MHGDFRKKRRVYKKCGLLLRISWAVEQSSIAVTTQNLALEGRYLVLFGDFFVKFFISIDE